MEFLILFLINVIKIVKYMILIRVLMSWIQSGPPGRFMTFIYEATEPILGLIRRILPRTGMIDLSPLIAFFVLDAIGIALMKGF